MFWRNRSGIFRLVHSSMKWAPLSELSLNRIPLLATMPDRVAHDPREPGHERRAVAGLELVEVAAVDDPRDDVADVERLAQVGRGDPVQLRRVVQRLARREHVPRRVLAPGRHVGEDAARDLEGVLVVVGEVVGDARQAGVDVRAAEVLGRDLLAGRRLHQRRAADEDRAGPLDDHRLVAHRRDVGAARGGRAHDDGDLRDPGRRQVGLVVEDPAEVLAIREHVGLQRQERPARVDEVDARQAVLGGDLLQAQVLLHRHREVRAALDRGVVGDDRDLAAADDPDAGHDPRRRRLAVVHVPGGERRQLEERGAGIHQAVDAIAREQLAPARVPRDGLVAAAALDERESLPQLRDQRQVGVPVGVEGGGPRGFGEDGHRRH